MSIPAPREADTQRAVIAYLELLGATVVRTNSGAVKTERRFVRFNRTSAGSCSDVLACLNGRFISVEVKRPGGRLTPGQAAFLDDVRRAGGVGVVVRSVDELRAALTAEGLAEG